jgi:cyclopropane-fatty-acyl-phospholipid synthase
MYTERFTQTGSTSPDAGTSGLVRDANLDRARRVFEHVFGPVAERTFAVRYWDAAVDVPPLPQPAFTFVLHSPEALRRMFFPPSELALGEAYVRGDFDIEGDLASAMRLADAIRARMTPRRAVALLARLLVQSFAAGRAQRPRSRFGSREGSLHSRERDAAAIRSHYDVGNDFYALWLDRRMVYSCAYFETGSEDIDAAQEAKLDHICRKLRLAPGDRLLDIGCGWGALVRHAAERYGVRALGVTLSPAQAEHARAEIRARGLDRRCAVEVADYRDLGERSRFDRIVSVGMFEHVGPQGMSEYFARVFRLLKSGGVFLNHGIVRARERAGSGLAAWLERLVWREGAFIDRYVFPDGDLVTLTTAVAAAEDAGFEVRDVESLREHYAMTLRRWGSRLEAAAAHAVACVGEETYRVWKLYMAGSAHGFARGRLGLAQILLARPDERGRVTLPLTRRDLYAGSTSTVAPLS